MINQELFKIEYPNVTLESKDEEIVRIVNCINSCWPEYPFTYADIRKPTGEKFRDVLGKFLQGFLGGNYQLPTVS